MGVHEEDVGGCWQLRFTSSLRRGRERGGEEGASNGGVGGVTGRDRDRHPPPRVACNPPQPSQSAQWPRLRGYERGGGPAYPHLPYRRRLHCPSLLVRPPATLVEEIAQDVIPDLPIPQSTTTTHALDAGLLLPIGITIAVADTPAALDPAAAAPPTASTTASGKATSTSMLRGMSTVAMGLMSHHRGGRA